MPPSGSGWSRRCTRSSGCTGRTRRARTRCCFRRCTRSSRATSSTRSGKTSRSASTSFSARKVSKARWRRSGRSRSRWGFTTWRSSRRGKRSSPKSFRRVALARLRLDQLPLVSALDQLPFAAYAFAGEIKVEVALAEVALDQLDGPDFGSTGRAKDSLGVVGGEVFGGSRRDALAIFARHVRHRPCFGHVVQLHDEATVYQREPAATTLRARARRLRGFQCSTWNTGLAT